MLIGTHANHRFDDLPFVENYPQPCSIESFQRELTHLFGSHDGTGQPWVRIVWAASEHGLLVRDWNEYGAGGLGEWRRRYVYSSSVSVETVFDEARGLHLAREVWKDVSPPRFALEKLIPPEVACIGWNDHAKPMPDAPNFAKGLDPDGDRFTARKPSAGIWVPIEFDDKQSIRGGIIADHNGHCCRLVKLDEDGAQCYGRYAEPGEKHLQILRKLATALNAAKERRPGLSTKEELAEDARRTAERRESYFENYRQRCFEIALDAGRTHRDGMLSSSPTAQKWGRWHFLGGHNRAGTPQKEKSE
jgi:hypothetical protein